MSGNKVQCGLKVIVPMLLGSLLLTGCGQKGDLYLPESHKHVVSNPDSTSSSNNNPANVPVIDPTVQDPNITLSNTTIQPANNTLQGSKNDY